MINFVHGAVHPLWGHLLAIAIIQQVELSRFLRGREL